jgi:hypothetical protein
MSQFLGHCLMPGDQAWTPPVHLDAAEACFRYCLLHHRWASEIRMTDEDDCLVLHVVAHVLRCPMPDGTRRETPLGGTP